MTITYLIDGYNVIHHCPQLQPLAQRDFEASREVLVDRVSRYCSHTGECARIVFDGRGRRQEPAPPPCGTAGVEIIYSPGHHTADTLIERMIYSAPNRRDYVAVSGDRGIRDLVRGYGGLVMSPAHFLTIVDDVLKRSSAALDAQTHRHRSNHLGDRLSDDSVKCLERLKGKLEG
ncbi:MAG: NYN domain-containing protein [Candidatus Hydrogenedentes bacterium]|nr:NYN domain-containing protein [Candidatus Hydrogenedentota bacterium]